MDMKPIGAIHTPFTDLEDMPIQPKGAAGVNGTVELYQEYHAGLQDLDGFSHVILVYLFHQSEGFELQVVPFLDTNMRGLFATRAPKRPNPIGISVVKLERIENGLLHVSNVDVLEGTPLLDIKPLVPQFDCPRDARTGWLAHSKDNVATKRSDDRFR